MYNQSTSSDICLLVVYLVLTLNEENLYKSDTRFKGWISAKKYNKNRVKLWLGGPTGPNKRVAMATGLLQFCVFM